MKLPNSSTHKFSIIKFIGTHNGVTHKDVARFIVEKLQRKTFNPKKGCGLWNISLYDKRRVNGIYPTYCVKRFGLWFLNPEAAELLRQFFAAFNPPMSVRIYNRDLDENVQVKERPISMLEKCNLPDDTIDNNSKVVSREYITIPFMIPEQVDYKLPAQTKTELELIVERLWESQRICKELLEQSRKLEAEQCEIQKRLNKAKSDYLMAHRALNADELAVKKFLGINS